MAKLSAHGKELVRMEKEETIADPKREAVWRKVSYALMEDGYIMKRIDVRFRPMACLSETQPKFHSYGWKVATKQAQNNLTSEQRRALFVQTFTDAGYKLVK